LSPVTASAANSPLLISPVANVTLFPERSRVFANSADPTAKALILAALIALFSPIPFALSYEGTKNLPSEESNPIPFALSYEGTKNLPSEESNPIPFALSF